MRRQLIVPIFLLLAGMLLFAGPPAHATFSIVAVDTVNGVVGGAGASCIDNCQIINDLIESVGAIHTQAYWLQANKSYARLLLSQGLSPDSIIVLLVANDAGGTPEYRQYGVTTLSGHGGGLGASAAFTGGATTPWAGHITGPGYAIQGNILISDSVIIDMEAAFLAADGPLEEKLMAAMEAAKRPGADERCIYAGKSAISAFIKVVRPGDGGTPSLYEIVPTTTGSTDPIDVLHAQYDTWRITQSAHADSTTVATGASVLDGDGQASTTITVAPRNWSGDTPVQIDSVIITTSGSGAISAVTGNGDGTFSATFTAPMYGAPDDTITVVVGSYYDFVTEVSAHPVITYFKCGDVTNDGDIKVSDLTYFINYMFRGGPAAYYPGSSDMNGDGELKISDLTFLIAYLFSGGPAPICD